MGEGWTARTDAVGAIVMERHALMDPVTLQVMANALRAVAEEMEAALVRSAFSPNIVERRDCSTAIFDGDGRMVVQSASIPVHLGAMPEAVAAARERGAAPGEVWLVNDPYRGGTHLPDLTMISALPLEGATAAYAVTRAHHADVGGMAPGSMPAGSRELLQEGLVIPPVRIVRDGAPVPDVVDLVLANTRAPGEREGDLRAQLAAHRLAERRLAEVAERHGADRVREAFGALLDYAERRTRAAIAAMPDGRYEAAEALEGDGVTEEDLWIRVAVTIAGDGMVVDFAGTDPQGPGNCNCPPAVTRSAVYFVVRSVTDPDIPASAGAFAPVEVRAPEGTLVNARPPAAVAGGNVETSSRIVDAVTAALGGGDRRARAGPGDDEQPHARRGRVHVLRDPGRRAGRLLARRRPVGRARGDEQHAEHADRGPRDRLPPARGGLPPAPRLRRSRAPPRRRRGRAAHPAAGGRRGLGHRRAPAPEPRGPGGRVGTAPGAAPR